MDGGVGDAGQNGRFETPPSLDVIASFRSTLKSMFVPYSHYSIYSIKSSLLKGRTETPLMDTSSGASFGESSKDMKCSIP